MIHHQQQPHALPRIASQLSSRMRGTIASAVRSEFWNFGEPQPTVSENRPVRRDKNWLVELDYYTGPSEFLQRAKQPQLFRETSSQPSSNRFVAVRLKDCGANAEIPSTALELRIDATSCPKLIVGTPLARILCRDQSRNRCLA